MKKLRLSALLVTTMLCAGCNFYETVEDTLSLPAVASFTSEKEADTAESGPYSTQINNAQIDCSSFPKVFESFSTKGLDGETYDQTMMAGKITLINMWGTYCGPCVKEMPHLAKLHKKYAEMDFQVVGVVIDVLASNGTINASKKSSADSIIKSAGVTYTSLLPCAGLNDFLNSTEYVPYSVFVDEHGHQLGESYTGGMDYSSWETAIKNTIYTYMY